MWNLAVQEGHRAAIVKEGGMKAIVDGMGAHIARAGLQKVGCGALRNLALDEIHRANIVEVGGIKAIVDGMRGHTSHAGVQEESCRALLSLVRGTAEARQEFKDLGVVELVKAAIASPSATESTKTLGQELLDRLEGRASPRKRKTI